MGKNSVIKTLGKRIGNVVLHRLLIEYTTRPESIHHLQSEEKTYRDQAVIDSREYNWNEGDKELLKEKSIEFINSIGTKKYPDLNFP